jgi:hypothetical protein
MVLLNSVFAAFVQYSISANDYGCLRDIPGHDSVRSNRSAFSNAQPADNFGSGSDVDSISYRGDAADKVITADCDLMIDDNAFADLRGSMDNDPKRVRKESVFWQSQANVAIQQNGKNAPEDRDSMASDENQPVCQGTISYPFIFGMSHLGIHT